MTAATNDRYAPQADVASVLPRKQRCPLGFADNVVGYAGCIAMIDSSGYLRPGRGGTSTDVAVGVFDQHYDNTITGHVAGNTANNLGNPQVDAGCFGFLNDTSSPILSTTAPGTTVYVLDNQTVTLASSGNSKAGTLAYLDPVSLLVYVVVYATQF